MSSSQTKWDEICKENPIIEQCYQWVCFRSWTFNAKEIPSFLSPHTHKCIMQVRRLKLGTRPHFEIEDCAILFAIVADLYVSPEFTSRENYLEISKAQFMFHSHEVYVGNFTFWDNGTQVVHTSLETSISEKAKKFLIAVWEWLKKEIIK